MTFYKGIRILDLSRLLPGGLTTKLFGDLGAEVIKIEEPKQGDYCRWEKPLIKNESYYHLILNGNKKSVKLDLKSQEGMDLFLKLVKESDIVFENFRPGVMERLGINYEVLKKYNSKIILCSISGYGQESPYQNNSAHDLNFLAMSGFLSLMTDGIKDPAIPGVPIVDIMTGLSASFAISTALYKREKTGEGELIDVSMYDVNVWSLSMIAGKFFVDQTENLREFAGTSPSYNVYKTSDAKFVALGAFETKFWKIFCEKIDREDLIPFGKLTNDVGAQIKNELNSIFRTKTRNEWIEFFKDDDICLSPVRELNEVFDDEHSQKRDLLYEIEHPTEGSIKQLSHPIRYANLAEFEKRSAPLFGEDTEKILSKVN
ncbi:CaiB/BaiF CoA-transferase family protein [Neobacillus novalis]|uniref:CaiB/BaiF CoA-transferase family protein n=1 Tax=Neobacillus novalis TaxID=220687 RepID=A0AA95S6S9_9BACI|nr:CaiB/BaiF CoA-transferase family protein [Neobacillus novalis]WHY84000.1 CaiB/BaiF CoA-transferase family protein [Neobacillus novalis]